MIRGIAIRNLSTYVRRDYPPNDINLRNLVLNWSNFKDRFIIFLGAGASIGAKNHNDARFPAALALRDIAAKLIRYPFDLVSHTA